MQIVKTVLALFLVGCGLAAAQKPPAKPAPKPAAKPAAVDPNLPVKPALNGGGDCGAFQLEQSFQMEGAVFLGKAGATDTAAAPAGAVLSRLAPNAPWWNTTFTVTERFKGGLPSSVGVSDSGAKLPNRGFTAGKVYLVFASERGGAIVLDDCRMITLPAAKDLTWLRGRTKQDHSIAGRLTGADGAPLADTWLELVTPAQHDPPVRPEMQYEAAQTGADGSFAFNVVPTGDYMLVAVQTGKRIYYNNSEVLHLEDKDLVGLNFSLP